MSETVIFAGGPLDGDMRELPGEAPDIFRVPVLGKLLARTMPEAANEPVEMLCGVYELSRTFVVPGLPPQAYRWFMPVYTWKGVETT